MRLAGTSVKRDNDFADDGTPVYEMHNNTNSKLVFFEVFKLEDVNEFYLETLIASPGSYEIFNGNFITGMRFYKHGLANELRIIRPWRELNEASIRNVEFFIKEMELCG